MGRKKVKLDPDSQDSQPIRLCIYVGTIPTYNTVSAPIAIGMQPITYRAITYLHIPTYI